MLNRKHVEDLVRDALSQGNVEKATKIATNFAEGRSTIKNMIKQEGVFNDLSNYYNPNALTSEEIERERAVNKRIENAETRGNLQGAPSLQLKTTPNTSASKVALANGMLVKAKDDYDNGTINGFKKAQIGLEKVAKLYDNAGDHQKARMARTTLKKMDPAPAITIKEQYDGETNPDRLRIMHGKLAKVYSNYGMSDRSQNALLKSVAGGSRRTKRSKKSNRRTRRH